MAKSSLIENAFVSSLRARGLEFETQAINIGTPDIFFRSSNVAIFVNGCYWHGHGCNKKFLNEKSQQRDLEVIKELNAQGIQSLIIWECELHKDFDKQVERAVTFAK